jgi:NAD(P)-dependent dehydrogenase (short-subunit alcohol dehydrogenase family)
MTAPIRFDGEVAVVTGAGRGIGRAEAVLLAERGANVVVNDVARERVDEVVAEIRASGGRAVPSYDSVSTVDGGHAIVQTALDSFGGLEALINNAGFLRCGYFEDLTLAQIDEVLDVHLRAAFHVTQPAWRVMKSNGYGRVLMTSSSSGMFSHHGLANYAAAKAGVYGLTKALAYEGLDHGIAVNALLPFADSAIGVDNPIPDWTAHRQRYIADDEQALLATRRDPMLTAVLSAYLVSRACTVSGEAFSACHGRYARVFVAATEGWLADGTGNVTIETLGAHFDQVRDTTRHSVPRFVFDEIADVARRLVEKQTV